MGKRIITVGDVHGRTYWKSIDPTQYDKIIFVGDYVDQFPPMKDFEIENNLLDIIEFKKQNPDKVILLLGNHDIQYLFLDEGFGCSGYRPSMAMNLKIIFKENKKLFQVAYQLDNYIWSHAGISQGWYDYNKADIEEIETKFETKNLAETLNLMMGNLRTNRLLHQISKKRGGYYNWGGVTWADRAETKNNYLSGYHQIVGHTPIDTITLFGDNNGSIRYVDVLNNVYFWEEDNKKKNTNEPYPQDMFYVFELI